MKILEQSDDVIIIEQRPLLKDYLFGFIGRNFKKHPIYYSIVLLGLVGLIFFADENAFSIKNIILAVFAIPAFFIAQSGLYYLFIYPFPLKITFNRKINTLDLMQYGVFATNHLTLPLSEITSIQYTPSLDVFNPFPQNMLIFYLKDDQIAHFTNFLGGYDYAIMLSEIATEIGKIISVPVKQSESLS